MCVSPVTPIQARTFAVWTLMSAAVRIYAAYNIASKESVLARAHSRSCRNADCFGTRGSGRLYDLSLISYVLALGHFALEVIVFRTAGLGPGVISPFIVASESQPSGPMKGSKKQTHRLTSIPCLCSHVAGVDDAA